MAAVAGGRRQHVFNPPQAGRLSLLVWCVLGIVLVAGTFFALQPTRLTASLGDTDDATRLVEVRELIDGRSWFDNTLPRLGGDQALHSHWSRLIDLPLAGLLTTFDRVMPQAAAELAVRIVWPLTLLLALLYLLGREAEMRGGRLAALLSIALAATCITAIVQFLPGRIDHHNAMILCATIGILRLSRSFDDADAGWSAGVFLGLGTVVGYEALALTIASFVAAMLYGLLPSRSLLGPSRAAVTFAATLAVALAATAAPVSFLTQHCDALSMNLVVLAVVAAVGVCAVQAMELRLSLAAKLAALLVTGAAGLALYGIAEPACFAGPFGQVEPALFPIWLGHVSETQSLFSLGGGVPLLAVAAFAYLLAGVYSGTKLLRGDGSNTVRFDLIMLLIAIPLSCWQIKLLPYATYLAVPLIAVWLARPSGTEDRQPVSRRTAAIVTVAVLLVVGFAAWFALTTTPASTNRVKEALDKVQDCTATAAIEPLATLPAGLAVADVNLGPYLVALTRLNALSAPYHRLGASIMAAHEILHSPPAKAEPLLRQTGASYVITCLGLDSTTPARADAPESLQGLLFANKPPAFLAPVTLAEPTPLKVWRVVQ